MTITIRHAAPHELAGLARIEREAATRFDTRLLPARLARHTVPLAHLRQALDAALLWVACGDAPEPVGFLVAEPLDGCLHIVEMSVSPAHGRQGLGTRLLQAACAHAAAAGHAEVTLTTFESVPWNAPFYARHGFRRIADAQLGPGLADRLAREQAAGLRDRIAMRRSVA